MAYSRSLLVPLLSLFWCCSLLAQDQVIEVRDVDRILVQYRQLPVFLSLANVDIPESGPIRQQALQRISELISGQGVQVLYDDAYGHDEAGIPRVYLRRGQAFVNVILVSEGLARYVPSAQPTTYERLLANAAAIAERDGLGLWGDGAVASAPPAAAAPARATIPEPTVAAVPPEPSSPPAARPSPQQTEPAARPAAPRPSGQRFVSELNATYYYPEGHPAVANVHRNRLIVYNDEESARAAGKIAAPAVNVASLPADDGSLQAADRVFIQGEQLIARAQAMPATRERDRAYTEALTVLTEAVQRYSNLLEQDENNEALGEKLRRAMQLRYGAMKMRRSPG
ncbi:MAG: hypothetical protein EA402_14070 [Planctomycetota bacterium]|nr:MAG: hypothetical protein EA402_14070 [Planctomycetota bacterium]